MTPSSVRLRHVARHAASLAIVASVFVPNARAYAADATASRLSKADDYPHKSIRVIDPFPAAGAGDIIVDDKIDLEIEFRCKRTVLAP